MAILLWLMLAAPLPAQQAAQPAPAAAEAPAALPTTRIERALAQPPALKPEQSGQVFRVEVFGKKPTIFDFIGTDVLKGPVPVGSSGHQEFLQMVTPEDVRGYAAFSNTEGAIVAATSLGNALIMKALLESFRKVGATVRNRKEQNLHNQVLAELAALQQARALAGLPPK